MKLHLFSVFDAATEQFIQPFYEITIKSATRAFSTACNDEGHEFSKNAPDYTLFHLGQFDQDKGTFELFSAPLNIGTAVSFWTPPYEAERAESRARVQEVK